MLKIRIAALALACTLLLAVLCGCGKEKTLTVTLRTMSTLGDAAEYDVYSSLTAEFSAEYPEIYIRDTSAPAADSFRLNAAKEATYTASSAPHVVYYTAEGGLSELSEYFVSVEEIREVYPDFASGISDSAFEGFRLADGRVYCVPIMGEWTGIAVNRAIFVENSLEVPTDWNSLIDAVNTLSANGVIPFANPADDCAAVLEALIMAYGPDNAAALGLRGYSNVIDPHWQTALSDLAQLFAGSAFAPASLTADIEQELMASAFAPQVSSSDVSGSDIAASGELFCGHPRSTFPNFYDNILGSERDRSTRIDAAELFCSGCAAMMIIDSTELSDINNADGCTVIPIPSPLGTENDVLMGGFRAGFAITRRAFSDPNYRDAAVGFVDFMTGKDAAEQFAQLGYLPANTDANISVSCAVGSLLSSTETGSYCLTTRTGAATAKWNDINRQCARLYYQLVTPDEICGRLADPELIWTEQATVVVSSSDAVSSSDTFSE